MYDLKELQAYAAVVRCGSLTKAARELDLPKSTLSRHLRQLEAALGHSLLRRESNQLIPNEAGWVFFNYCSDILNLAQRSRDELDELNETVTGRLVLRCHEALIRGWFSRVLDGFMQKHPTVEVSLHTQLQLPDDNLDTLCLWLGSSGETLLRQDHLGFLAQGVYGHPEYLERHGRPETPADLQKLDWVDLVRMGSPQPDSNEIKLFHRDEGSYTINLPSCSMVVDQFVLQGDAIARKRRGVGVMPCWLTEQRALQHPGEIERCLPDWQGPSLPVWLLYPHGTLPRRIRAFIEHIKQVVPEEWRQR